MFELMDKNSPFVIKFNINIMSDIQQSNITMLQGTKLDPAKGQLRRRPTLNTRRPLMQPTQISRKIENQIFLFEAMGVFVMVYGSSCFNQSIGFDLQFTFAIMMTFAVCNHPSNSNLNPMVTLAFCLRHTKRYQFQLFWFYIKAQFTGAFLGVIFANVLNNNYRFPMVPRNHNITEYMRIALSQCVGVFVLIVLVLQVVGPNTIYTTKKFSRYIYIAFMVFIGRKFAPTSGTALNAAITLSRAVLGIWYNDWQGLKYYGLWLVGDIAGCLLATYFYNYVLQPSIVYSRIKKMMLLDRYHELSELSSIKKNRPFDNKLDLL